MVIESYIIYEVFD